MSDAKKPDWRDVLLNVDGDDLIYETPGDATRGNPLDIITVATAVGGRDVTGFHIPTKGVAKELARRWNAGVPRPPLPDLLMPWGLEKFIRELPRGSMTDHELTLVAGNLRHFAATLREEMGHDYQQ